MDKLYTLTATQSEGMVRHLAAIVESSDDAIYSILPDGTVMSWNRGAERTFGYRAGEIIGRNASILCPDERVEELIDTMDRIKRGDHVGHFETARVRKGGRPIPVSVSISPMTNPEGQVTGASVIAHDITWRRKNELEQTRLIEELTEALSKAKTLAGLLPICAHCKKIRDEEGDWHQVEAYISQHSDAEFTHGICPQCFKVATSDTDRIYKTASAG